MWTVVEKKGKDKTAPKVFDLATFKTAECPDRERHDWRQCQFFHIQQEGNSVDRRRNPFTTPYDPSDAKNSVETSYHPCEFLLVDFTRNPVQLHPYVFD